MKLLKYKTCFTFLFSLIFTGAFSLLWMRQQVYLQASQNKILEKQLASLINLNKRADLCIAQLNSKNTPQQSSLQTEKVIWISTQQEEPIYTPLAFNR